MPSSLLTSFLGALQACVSVLLTLSYGAAARKLGLIQRQSIHDVSSLGVKVLLPALILVHLGEQLQLGNVLNYVPVLVWSILYTLSSIGLARLASKVLNLPDWVTPTCAFNNTTSLPLLLLQSLESVGSLKMIVRDGESVSEAVARAQSYFLLCGVLSKTIGYIVGPKMLTGGTGSQDQEDADEDHEQDQNGHEPFYTIEEGGDEESPLLNRGNQKKSKHGGKDISSKFAHFAKTLPRRLKETILPPYDNPTADMAILCTLIGGVLGLVPPLHKAFFNSYEEGGIFNAWLTTSIKNTGKLFTTLQVLVVGCELAVSFEKMRDNKDGGNDNDENGDDADTIRGSGSYDNGSESESSNPGVKAILTVFLIRLVVWPALSISIIYGLARKTSLLRSDPVLWFSMMLMPAGPPALVIQGLAELAKASEATKMTIAKTLTIMYILSPCISFTITGALKACQSILDSKMA